MPNKSISQEVLVRDQQAEIAKRLKPIMRQLGAWRADEDPGRVWLHEWTPENMSVVLNDPHKAGDRKKINRVVFKGLYFSKEVKIEDSEPRITFTGEQPVPGFANKLIDHTGLPDDAEVDKTHIYYYKQLQHETSFTTSVNASVESTSTVKVEGPVASFEQQIKVAVETALSSAERQQRDLQDGVDEYIMVRGGETLLYTISTVTAVKITPVDFVGYPDFLTIRLDFEDWSGRNRTDAAGLILLENGRWGKHKELEVKGFIGLEQLLKGGDWRIPGMRSYPALANGRSKSAMAWLFDEANRTIRVQDERREVYEDSLKLDATLTPNPRLSRHPELQEDEK